MTILFIFTTEDAQSVERPIRSLEHIQYGISILSAVLKREGLDCRLLVLSQVFGKRYRPLLEKTIRDYQPSVVCMTAVSTQYPFVKQIASDIRAIWPSIYQVIGGPHASVMPDEVIRDGFDAVCVGEGEQSVVELVHQLTQGKRPSGIPNLWIRQTDGSVEQNSQCSFLDDLDQLPFPDREMWLPWCQDTSQLSVLLGRGCPYQCTYCSNHVFKKMAPGKYVRFRSVANVMDEIQMLTVQFPQVQHIYLEVETLNIQKEWTIQLCDELARLNATREVKLTFSTNYRVDANSADERVFDGFRRAGFSSVNIGLESGSERIRREVLNRLYTNEDFFRVVNMAQSFEIEVNLYNLIGLPDETVADIRETIRVNRVVQPKVLFTSIFFPYPGTRLYDLCLERGYVTRASLDTSRERRHSVLQMPQISRWQIKWFHIWFELLVYRGYKPMGYLLLKAVYLWLISYSMAHLVLRKLRGYLLF